MKKAVLVLSILMFYFVASQPVFADEGTTADYFSEIGTKFVRGLGNVLTSPLEIGCGIKEEVAERKSVGVFTGLGKGSVMMLRRIFVGVNEAITFVIPMEPTLPPTCFLKKNG